MSNTSPLEAMPQPVAVGEGNHAVDLRIVGEDAGAGCGVGDEVSHGG